MIRESSLADGSDSNVSSPSPPASRSRGPGWRRRRIANSGIDRDSEGPPHPLSPFVPHPVDVPGGLAVAPARRPSQRRQAACAAHDVGHRNDCSIGYAALRHDCHGSVAICSAQQLGEPLACLFHARGGHDDLLVTVQFVRFISWTSPRQGANYTNSCTVAEQRSNWRSPRLHRHTAGELEQAPARGPSRT